MKITNIFNDEKNIKSIILPDSLKEVKVDYGICKHRRKKMSRESFNEGYEINKIGLKFTVVSIFFALIVILFLINGFFFAGFTVLNVALIGIFLLIAIVSSLIDFHQSAVWNEKYYYPYYNKLAEQYIFEKGIREENGIFYSYDEKKEMYGAEIINTSSKTKKMKMGFGATKNEAFRDLCNKNQNSKNNYNKLKLVSVPNETSIVSDANADNNASFVDGDDIENNAPSEKNEKTSDILEESETIVINFPSKL